MKKAFIPKSLRPSIAGSTYNLANKSQIILREEVTISKILDLSERSKIIKRLFKETDSLSQLDSELVEDLKSCLINPGN